MRLILDVPLEFELSELMEMSIVELYEHWDYIQECNHSGGLTHMDYDEWCQSEIKKLKLKELLK